MGESTEKTDNKKERKNGLTASNILVGLSILLSLVSLLISIYPKINPSKKYNYEERAAAGDSEIQMYLADLYFKEGKYDESFRWYDALLKNDELPDESKAKVANNLGYIHLVYAQTQPEKSAFFYRQAFEAFNQAAVLESIEGRLNAYNLVREFVLQAADFKLSPQEAQAVYDQIDAVQNKEFLRLNNYPLPSDDCSNIWELCGLTYIESGHDYPALNESSSYYFGFDDNFLYVHKGYTSHFAEDGRLEAWRLCDVYSLEKTDPVFHLKDFQFILD